MKIGSETDINRYRCTDEYDAHNLKKINEQIRKIRESSHPLASWAKGHHSVEIGGSQAQLKHCTPAPISEWQSIVSKHS